MEFGDDGVVDPVEESLEAEQMQAEGEAVAAAFLEILLVDPNPEVAEHQRDGDEY